jgi:hypothetical protein
MAKHENVLAFSGRYDASHRHALCSCSSRRGSGLDQLMDFIDADNATSEFDGPVRRKYDAEP